MDGNVCLPLSQEKRVHGCSGFRRVGDDVKIAQVNLQPDYGGAEAHVGMLARGLQARGHDVRLLCHPLGRLRKDAERAGLQTQPLRVRNQLAPVATLRMAALLRHDRPDVLHLHTPKEYLCGLAAGRLAGVGVVVLTRHMLLPLKPLMRKAYARADAVICLSGELQTLLLRQSLPLAKLPLIYGAIDTLPFTTPQHPEAVSALRHSWGMEPDTAAVGCVGRLVDGKGQEVLMEAFARCRARFPEMPLGLALVGDGPKRPELEALANSLGIKDRVQFAGFRNDIPLAMAALDIVTVPSTLTELLPLSVMEGMAAGRPVIASHMSGVSEIITNGITGLLVPPGNGEALGDALQCLLSDARLRRRIAGEGAKRVQRQFALPRLLDETEALYAGLLKGTSGDQA